MDVTVERVEGSESRQPSPSKAFYTIFPKIGTGTSKTREFVKDIVGTEDLLPWTDLQEQLVLWTIEASPDEVAQLRGYADVDKVVEFRPAEAPADSGTSFTITRSIRDMPAVERLAERQEPVAEYLVFAKDGKNQAETNQTEQMLQNLVGKDNVDPPFTHKNQLRYWLCNMTTSQHDQAAKDPGVKSIGPNADLVTLLITWVTEHMTSM